MDLARRIKARAVITTGEYGDVSAKRLYEKEDAGARSLSLDPSSGRLFSELQIRQRRQHIVADVKITVRKNGNYMIEGPIQLVDAAGNPFPLGEGPIFLCRCGQSSTKPFCDGTHRKAEFDADTRAPFPEG